MLNKLKSILPEKINTPHCEPIAELKRTPHRLITKPSQK
jgi:hypothetical protein